MELKEFQEKKELALKVIRALQGDVAPKGIGIYKAGVDPEKLIDRVILNNPTWHPDDIYFPGFKGKVNEEFPLEPTGHVALILGLTEGPAIHKVEYHGKSNSPDSFEKGIGKKIQVNEGCVVATLDNRLLGGYAGIYWFDRQKDDSLKYKRWNKIGNPDDTLPLG